MLYFALPLCEIRATPRLYRTTTAYLKSKVLKHNTFIYKLTAA